MGDVGSVTLGFLAGTLALLGVRDGVFDVWVPVIVFAPFIADATVTVLRRAIRRETLWEAHRTHYYQRLVLHGWSHRKTVLAEYALMLFCGGAAMTFQQGTGAARMVVIGVCLVVFASLAVAVHLAERRGKARVPMPSSVLGIAAPSPPTE
jgi:sterol desaturase/sphingolipid hydroxylase (fatty acid hydroxylase superfamily)